MCYLFVGLADTLLRLTRSRPGVSSLSDTDLLFDTRNFENIPNPNAPQKHSQKGIGRGRVILEFDPPFGLLSFHRPALAHKRVGRRRSLRQTSPSGHLPSTNKLNLTLSRACQPIRVEGSPHVDTPPPAHVCRLKSHMPNLSGPREWDLTKAPDRYTCNII